MKKSINESIRKANAEDIGRISEILVFTKRASYRSIFCNDKVSFGEMQVITLADEYKADLSKIEPIWVYDDEFVKGIIHIEANEIKELYIDTFFRNQGIGKNLIEFAINNMSVSSLWVLEKNKTAIEFYRKFGFTKTQKRMLVEDTTEYEIQMIR